MSEKSEALRLADALTEAAGDYWQFHKSIGYGAAAELRRLAAVEAQRDALKQTLHDELAGNLRLRDLGGARPDEPMLTFLERIIAERDALLEALKLALSSHGVMLTSYPPQDAWKFYGVEEKARAAIKKAEGGQ